MDIATKLGDMNCFKYNEQRVPRLTIALGIVPLN